MAKRTLDMPQRPDAMSISDHEGNQLYSARFDTQDFGRRFPTQRAAILIPNDAPTYDVRRIRNQRCSTDHA